MEQPVHEVAADPQLRVCGIRVAHGCEQTGLETVERVPLPFVEVAASEEPLFALDGGLLSMTIVAKREVAVRHEVWDDDFGGRGRNDRRDREYHSGRGNGRGLAGELVDKNWDEGANHGEGSTRNCSYKIYCTTPTCISDCPVASSVPARPSVGVNTTSCHRMPVKADSEWR